MRIGFFDSGIGGLTVLHQALKFLPHEDYLFYADTAHVPYGEKTKEEVREYILNAVDFIAKHHVKALVVACNTATSIVIEELRNRYDFPILGIEPAVKPAIEKSEGKMKRRSYRIYKKNFPGLICDSTAQWYSDVPISLILQVVFGKFFLKMSISSQAALEQPTI